MKCEICHKAEAVTAITAQKDGTECELYVCADCAKKSHNDKHDKKPAPPAPNIKMIGGPDAPPPPFIEDFVKATIGFIQEVTEAEQNDKLICPKCKSKWNQIKESGRIGCAACWKTFARNIREEFLSAQYGLAHRGKAPAVETVSNKKDARSVLEHDLKDAVAREDYRQAARLKKMLDQLKKDSEA